MLHGTKAVVAVAVDPSGARLATGSIDYEVSFWDFAGNYFNTLFIYRITAQSTKMRENRGY